MKNTPLDKHKVNTIKISGGTLEVTNSYKRWGGYYPTGLWICDIYLPTSEIPIVFYIDMKLQNPTIKDILDRITSEFKEMLTIDD